MQNQNTLVPLACAHCGTPFVVPVCRAAKRRCCSRACDTAYRKAHPRRSAAERFWAKVNKTDSCWVWTGALNEHGYGVFHWGAERHANRAAWILLRGPIPGGLFVLHNCPGGDNPACVNPDHLWLGTQAQNMADAAAKGRTATGARNGWYTQPERRKPRRY